MFMPYDQPLAGRVALHKRSKTISVLKTKSQNNVVSPVTKKLNHKKYNYRSVCVIKANQNPQEKPQDSFRKYHSLQSMTEQIQRLINRENCYSQLLTSVEKYSGRSKTIENEDPQGQEFNDTFYIEKNKKNIEKCSGFREPQYMELLKKTQRLNSRGFVPHFNWKEKLNRMKNVGNYGHVYKKHQKPAQKKPAPRQERPKKSFKPELKDYVIDSTKILIDPQIIISRGLGFDEIRIQRKLSACKRCYTSLSQYPPEIEKRFNQTVVPGERFNNGSRKQSQGKPLVLEKPLRKDKNDWQFEPWDVNS